MALVNLQESCPARANDRVRSLPQRYATKTALACCMSTVQLPKLADRCPERAHDLYRIAAAVALYRAAFSLLYEAAKASPVWSAVLNAYPHGAFCATSTASRPPWWAHERCET